MRCPRMVAGRDSTSLKIQSSQRPPDSAEEKMDRKISSPFSPCPSWGAHPRGKGHSRFAVRQRRSLDRCGERGKIVVPLVHGRSHLNVEWPWRLLRRPGRTNQFCSKLLQNCRGSTADSGARSPVEHYFAAHNGIHHVRDGYIV